MDLPDLAGQTPVEQLAVSFFEYPCLALRASDGFIYISLVNLCEAVGLDDRAQRRRLQRDAELSDGLRRFRAQTAGGEQEILALQLEYVPLWLTTISRARATPMVQERLRYLRLWVIREVYNAFARATGLPQGSSQQIEDLRDLDRLDPSLTQLAERQQSLEASQDAARRAWSEHERRIAALEAVANAVATNAAPDSPPTPPPISNAQRGVLFHMIEVWAPALAAHTPQMTVGNAKRTCWSTLVTRYRVASYHHIPARQYADAVAFIRQSYQRLTGEPFPDPTQDAMDLGDAV